MRVNSESISMRYFEIISIELETILELEKNSDSIWLIRLNLISHSRESVQMRHM